MGIYASFGCSQALLSFCMGATFSLLTYFASQQLHKVFGSLTIASFVYGFGLLLGGDQASHARSNVILRNYGVYARLYFQWHVPQVIY